MRIKNVIDNKKIWLSNQIRIVESSVLFTQQEAKDITSPLKAQLERLERQCATSKARNIEVINHIDVVGNGVR